MAVMESGLDQAAIRFHVNFDTTLDELGQNRVDEVGHLLVTEDPVSTGKELGKRVALDLI